MEKKLEITILPNANAHGYLVYGVKDGVWARNVWIKDCPANCKLTYMNYASQLIMLKSKLAFDEILKNCRVAVSLNVNNKPDKDWILNNYEVYACSPIPIGYGLKPTDQNHCQYHIVIKNPFNTGLYARPTLFVKDEPLKESNIEFKAKLIQLLKQNRRKLDLVDDILALI